MCKKNLNLRKLCLLTWSFLRIRKRTVILVVLAVFLRVAESDHWLQGFESWDPIKVHALNPINTDVSPFKLLSHVDLKIWGILRSTLSSFALYGYFVCCGENEPFVSPGYLSQSLGHLWSFHFIFRYNILFSCLKNPYFLTFKCLLWLISLHDFSSNFHPAILYSRYYDHPYFPFETRAY